MISNEGFHIIDFTLLRSILGIAISSILCVCNGMNPLQSFPWELKYKLIGSCIASQLAYGLIFLAVSMAPISLALLCWTTTPFWISIIGYFINGEHMILMEILAMIVCFACVSVILTQSKDDQDQQQVDAQEGDYVENQTLLGLVIALIAAICSGFFAALTRSLKQVPVNVSIFYNCIIGMIITILYLLIETLVSTPEDGLRMFSYTGWMYGISMISNCLDNLVLYLFLIAFTSDASGFVAVLSYTRILWAYVAD